MGLCVPECVWERAIIGANIELGELGEVFDLLSESNGCLGLGPPRSPGQEFAGVQFKLSVP